MPIGLDCRDDLAASYTEAYIRFGDSPWRPPCPQAGDPTIPPTIPHINDMFRVCSALIVIKSGSLRRFQGAVEDLQNYLSS